VIAVLIRERLLSLEKPVETALLASLTGMKCFYGNQWHCRLTENATKLSTVLQGSHFIHFIQLYVPSSAVNDAKDIQLITVVLC